MARRICRCKPIAIFHYPMVPTEQHLEGFGDKIGNRVLRNRKMLITYEFNKEGLPVMGSSFLFMPIIS